MPKIFKGIHSVHFKTNVLKVSAYRLKSVFPLGRLLTHYPLTWKLEPCFFSQDQDNLDIKLKFVCLSFSTCKQFPIKIYRKIYSV